MKAKVVFTMNLYGTTARAMNILELEPSIKDTIEYHLGDLKNVEVIPLEDQGTTDSEKEGDN
jgi:hypothetical protein